MKDKLWFGFDLDGTLAYANHTFNASVIGDPVPKVVSLLKAVLKAGYGARIVTARVAASRDLNFDGVADSEGFAAWQRTLIDNWVMKHIGVRLPITASKDFRMVALIDDLAISAFDGHMVMARARGKIGEFLLGTGLVTTDFFSAPTGPSDSTNSNGNPDGPIEPNEADAE